MREDGNMGTGIDILRRYASWQFGLGTEFTQTTDWRRVVDRLSKVPQEPLTLTHANQLLHLCHQTGVTQGFFRDYALQAPAMI